ncbi:hypothetical protein MRX96_035407 [Rhipicephalus microplus]
MATPNQVTGYDPESLQIIQMDTAQTETPLPTDEEYLKDMLRIWRGRKNTAVASRDARAPAAKQQQQIGELRRQNQILARKIQELEAKQVGSSEPVQEAEAEDGDDGSSVTSLLTSVSWQDADTVVGPPSITGSIGRIESLEHKTEQLEASVAALPDSNHVGSPRVLSGHVHGSLNASTSRNCGAGL